MFACHDRLVTRITSVFNTALLGTLPSQSFANENIFHVFGLLWHAIEYIACYSTNVSSVRSCKLLANKGCCSYTATTQAWRYVVEECKKTYVAHHSGALYRIKRPGQWCGIFEIT